MATSWVDLIWTDIVGRPRVVRAAREAAEEGGLTVRRGELLGGFVGSDDERLLELVPDWTTERSVPWETGLAVCFADLREDGEPSPHCPRSFLRSVAAGLAGKGRRIEAAVELEFYLVDPATGLPVYEQIDNYSVSRVEPEAAVTAIRNELRAMAVGVEASNPEYGGGQYEINIARADLLSAADQAALARYFTAILARRAGLDATYLSKPWTDRSTSGIHVHQSLWEGDRSVFFDDDEGLSAAAKSFMAGLLEAMPEFALLTSPTPNGFHRRADGSFAPTGASWAVDNRTTAVRAVLGGESATRVEHRDGSADCNLYLTMGAQVLAGIDGIERGAELPAAIVGNAYAQDLPLLPRTFVEAYDRLRASELAARLVPGPLLEAYLQALAPEVDLAIVSSADWERDRYSEIPLA
jgi:glutamine synthetase